MFTGIVEEQGIVKNIQKSASSMQLSIQADRSLEDIKLGDSISVNGVCLTVITFSQTEFTVDVMPETFHATTTNLLKNGSAVNLERAMGANGRFGGHFVSGHVDGVGTILKKRPTANAVYIDITVPEDVSHFCIPKGSITVDGTSLTIFEITKSTITISLIPHTNKETVLGMKKERELVNIECDMLGKYMYQYVKNKKESTITQDFLKQNGF
ncbi:riboflavin synthase [Psychrobacillus psychrodurans]|uniref:riboflavin synthase n=1 Tax=Psychrobacillus psychrodurans TaxID=126157 RepID=UPI001F4D4569|nr:riboflavin synthase [Psychrobacillus psychrodurans]MCK1996077.1 riboflavin synthase [Psychrobacillus psychrodurans]